MSRQKVKVPEVYVKGRNPENYMGNGRLVFAKAQQELAAYANMLIARRVRVIGSTYMNPDDVTASSNDIEVHGRTSYGCKVVRMSVLCLPASTSATGSSDPRMQFWVRQTDTTAGTVETTYFRTHHVGRRKLAGSTVPDDYFTITQDLVPANAEDGGSQVTREFPVPCRNYTFGVDGADWLRPFALLVFEVPQDGLFVRRSDDENSGTGPAFTLTGPVPTDYVILTDGTKTFDYSYIGEKITVAGSTSAGNDGDFFISNVPSATQIEYFNPSGVAESFASGTSYTIADRIAYPGASSRVTSPIVDTTVSDVHGAVRSLWREQGGGMGGWAATSANQLTTTSTSFVNIFEGSGSTYSATARGFYVFPRYRGHYADSEELVVFWAFGVVTVGPGTTATLEFRDSSGVLATLTDFNTLKVYESSPVPIPTTSDDLLIQVFMKVDTGGGTTVVLRGCGMYPYDDGASR